MKYRRLGPDGPEVSAIGLGCMGMSDTYGDHDAAEAERVIARALDLGINLLNTADFYGDGHNEELIGRAINGRRDAAFIATKFGVVRQPDGHRRLDGTPAHVAAACDGSLKRLGVEALDLFILARVDPATPIEETVGAMAALKSAGKVRHIGLSEVSAATLRRAHAVAPLTAVESEYALWTRDPEDGVLPACAALGIGFLAFSPLGRGFFAGALTRFEDLPEDDRRHRFPRFARENFERNRRCAERVEALASDKGATPAQVALAWLLAKNEIVVPIPGTKRLSRLEENAGAVDIALSAAEVARLEAAVPSEAVAGARFNEAAMAQLGR